MVYCRYKEDGCKWYGSSTIIEEHEHDCLYPSSKNNVLITCKSCGESMGRFHLEMHEKYLCKNRKVTCFKCAKTFVFNDFMAHSQECLKNVAGKSSKLRKVEDDEVEILEGCAESGSNAFVLIPSSKCLEKKSMEERVCALEELFETMQQANVAVVEEDRATDVNALKQKHAEREQVATAVLQKFEKLQKEAAAFGGLENLIETLASSKMHLKEHELHVKALEESVVATEKRVYKLESNEIQPQEHELHLKSLKDSLVATNKKVDKLEEKLESLNGRLDEIINCNAELIGDVTELKNKEENRGQLDALKTKMFTNGQLDALQMQMSTNGSDMEAVKEAIEQDREQLDTLKQRVDSIADRVALAPPDNSVLGQLHLDKRVEALQERQEETSLLLVKQNQNLHDYVQSNMRALPVIEQQLKKHRELFELSQESLNEIRQFVEKNASHCLKLGDYCEKLDDTTKTLLHDAIELKGEVIKLGSQIMSAGEPSATFPADYSAVDTAMAICKLSNDMKKGFGQFEEMQKQLSKNATAIATLSAETKLVFEQSDKKLLDLTNFAQAISESQWGEKMIFVIKDMQNHRRAVKDGGQGIVYSGFWHLNGYKLQCCLSVSKGPRHAVTLSVFWLRGEQDNLLIFPFACRLKLKFAKKCFLKDAKSEVDADLVNTEWRAPITQQYEVACFSKFVSYDEFCDSINKADECFMEITASAPRDVVD